MFGLTEWGRGSFQKNLKSLGVSYQPVLEVDSINISYINFSKAIEGGSKHFVESANQTRKDNLYLLCITAFKHCQHKKYTTGKQQSFKPPFLVVF